MLTKMAVSQPLHFGSRGKLPKSEHLWQGDTSAHAVRADTPARKHTYIITRGQRRRVCRAGPPIDRLLGKFHTCDQGCQGIY